METVTASETVVQLTPNAAAEVRAMQAKPENVGKPLRLYVEQGGCSGLQYGMTFDEERPGDHVSRQHDLTVVVDEFSAQYLRGTVMDFSDALTGGGFKLNNPNAKQSCGCGKSFEAGA